MHISRFCALTTGAVLVLAALSKISDFREFYLYVSSITIFPHWLAASLSVLIPATELGVGGDLLSLNPAKSSRWIGIALFAVFFLFQCIEAIPALSLTASPCACFGKLFPNTGTMMAIARGGILLSIALIAEFAHINEDSNK